MKASRHKTTGDWLKDLIHEWGHEFEDWIKDPYEFGVPSDKVAILAERIRAAVAEREAAQEAKPVRRVRRRSAGK